MLESVHPYFFIASIFVVPLVVVFLAGNRLRAALWTALLFLFAIGAIVSPQILDALNLPAGSTKNQLLLKHVSTVLGTSAIGALMAYRFFALRAWWQKRR